MNKYSFLRSTIVLLLLSSVSLLKAQSSGESLLSGVAGCTTDIHSPIPDHATRDGWREYAEILPANGVTGGQYGHAVSIDGNYAVVGAPNEVVNGVTSGAAYVYYRQQHGWTLQARLIPSDGNRGDGFGSSVDIKGTTIVVGAPWEEDHNSHSNAGAVYVFRRTATSWSQTNKLSPAQRTKSDEFGFSLDLNNFGLWIGALTKETGDKTAGSVYNFTYNGTTWTEGIHLLAREAHLGGSFGYDVKANDENTMLIIGAPTEDAGGKAESGLVYVYERSGSTWAQSAALYLASGAAYEHFGSSVSMTGRTLVVGAPGSEVDAATGGNVYVLDRSLVTRTWSITGQLSGSGLGAGRFGHSVQISGDSLLVGSPNTSSIQSLGGSAYLYVKGPAGWQFSDTVLPLQTEAGGRFGTSVALDYGYLLVGGDAHDGTVPETGSVFLLEENYVLPAADLTLCKDPVTAATALATDNCAGSVMGAPNATTTFDVAGSYDRVWNFSDGNGNFSSAVQAIEVVSADLSLPYREASGMARRSQDCWSAGDEAANVWGKAKSLVGRLAKPAVFALQGSSLGNHLDRLRSPVFDLTAGTEYLVSFEHGTLEGPGTEGLRLMLIDDVTGQEIKQLYRDEAISTSSVFSDLVFTVPASGRYRVAFEAWGGAGSPGLLLDNLLIQEHTAANGWPGLSGNADDQCTEAEAKGLNGYARARFFDGSGKLVAEIDANGNDLGDVVIAMTDYSDVPVAPYAGRFVMSRYFDIVPENGSGPYLNNGGVRVRLYFAPDELGQFNRKTGFPDDWSDLTILHYSGDNQDCRIDNSTGKAFRQELLELQASFSDEDHYLEFQTTSFSEFAASSESALPVTLTDFSAAAAPRGNRLHWQVEGERDFSHYGVERSRDGRTFAPVSSVAARGAYTYEYLDAEPFAVSFYRLRLVDIDGTTEFSPVIRVGRPASGSAAAYSAYPVPTDGRTTVSYVLSASGPVTFRLTGLGGRVLRSLERTGQPGTNREEIDLEALPAGTYYLNVRTVDEVHNLTLVRR